MARKKVPQTKHLPAEALTLIKALESTSIIIVFGANVYLCS